MTWSELMKPFKEERDGRVAAGKLHPVVAQSNIHSLSEAAEFFGRNEPVAVIDTKEHVARFVESLLKKGRMPSTINGYLTALGLAFKLAIRENAARVNPVTLHGRLQTNDYVDVALLPSELFALLDLDLPPLPTKLVIALGCFAGLRLGESFGLKWRYVDRKNNCLRIAGQWMNKRGDPHNTSTRQPKWGSNRIVPISRHLEPYLSGKVISMSEFVVTNDRGQNYGSYDTFDYRYHEMLKKGRHIFEPAIIRAAMNPEEFNYRTHDFRHTFATCFANAGGRELVLRSILGHGRRKKDVTSRYYVIHDTTMKEDMVKFDDYLDRLRAQKLPSNLHQAGL
ncbi:MAG: hypothetical protein A3G34_07940 [Candidatus Lindowbacteria bacterium RIFCSPLOWO2_12_FULL_62_27]|nr:MAG: hypothetical protein A3G34_07940 [Candidatus Lindowbacteria bacterium RIFCSPLOWO2_12_FULL_62_27]OGH63585.1 MAG: hypothetical protein A3I06_13960 [Candidatus Lindowbacteria bacterium RIFCSPLOWO2_02_FULL_62_12]